MMMMMIIFQVCVCACVLAADGNLVDLGGGVHVSESYRQDVSGQVVRKSHGPIAQLWQTKAQQNREIRGPLRALSLRWHGIDHLLDSLNFASLIAFYSHILQVNL